MQMHGDGESKAPDRIIEPWSLKDGLVAIPSLASALALSWEVGYFLKIGGGSFGLFSLVEHITFAVQALPFALFLTTLAVVTVFTRLFVGTAPSLTRRMSSFFLSGAFTGALFKLVLELSGLRMDVGLVIISILAGVPLFLILTVPRELLKSWIVISLSLLLTFVLALAIGVETARVQITNTQTSSIIRAGEKGKEAETEIEIKVRILRTGERGVLYFDPAARNFGLLPWVSVKRIDWVLSPLLHWRSEPDNHSG
jgi:hypothetical protein